MNLASFPARRCFTAAGFCLHQGKILLVKHKKLGIWLAPGGHLELNELPHEAAVREVKEETGLTVIPVSGSPLLPAVQTQNLPQPFSLNLHWISQENYHLRQNSAHPDTPHRTPTWPLGCEQHLSFNYLVKSAGPARLIPNQTETDDVAWFAPDAIAGLKTAPDIKTEIYHVFSLKPTK